MKKSPRTIGNQIFSLKCGFGIDYSIGREYRPIWVSVSVSVLDLNQNSGFGCTLFSVPFPPSSFPQWSILKDYIWKVARLMHHQKMEKVNPKVVHLNSMNFWASFKYKNFADFKPFWLHFIKKNSWKLQHIYQLKYKTGLVLMGKCPNGTLDFSSLWFLIY